MSGLEDILRRTGRVVRAAEGIARGRDEGERWPTAPSSDVYVVADGLPIKIDDIGPYTVSGTSVPAPAVKVVYPGKFVYRQPDQQTNGNWYHDTNERCWVAELNNQGLWLGRRYLGGQLGEVAGLGVIGVDAACDPQKLLVLDDIKEVTIAGVDYWACAVTNWNSGAGIDDSSTVVDDDVLIFDPTGGSFSSGQKVWGKLVGPVTGTALYGSPAGSGYSGEVWTAFELLTEPAGVGGPTDVKLFLIEGFYIRDNPALVTDPSPNPHYPGAEVKLTKAGFVPTGFKAWVVPTHNMASVDNGPGLPFTMFVLDGTDYCFAIPNDEPGYTTYAPLDGSDPPFAFDGDSRPVYMTTQYAADWAIQCISGMPKGVLG